MLWHKLYGFIPQRSLRFPALPAHIARGARVSSRFAAARALTAWIAPAYPYFVAAVFKIFGSNRRHRWRRTGGAMLMAGATGLTICILGQRRWGPGIGLLAGWILTLGPFFLSLVDLVDMGFYRQRALLLTLL